MPTYSLEECILEFVEPAAYQATLKGNINRVSIFNIACRQAFKENSQTKYAEALRALLTFSMKQEFFMTRYIWLTNTSAYSKTRVMNELNADGSRKLISADPRPTEQCSAYELRREGIVGIYEVKNG